MSREFVTLTTPQFLDWANETFGEGDYDITTPKQGREMVIRYDFKIEGLECHVFTTVEPNQQTTRGLGEDAIRVHLFDRFAGCIAHMETKILRVDGDTSVFERLTQRVESIIKIAMALKKQDRFCKCKQNRVVTKKKVNTKNGNTFFGCALFPHCEKPLFNKLENAKKQYPLKFDPFKDVTELMSTLTHDAEQKLAVAIKASYDINSEKQAKEFKTWDVVEEEECVPTELWKHVKYPFAKFNRVQSTCFKSEVWKRDVNFVLGTATSSGKTITAELLIAHALYGNKT